MLYYLFRVKEYIIFFYRLSLTYLFYFFARLLFYFYNHDLIAVNSLADFLRICINGLKFDTTAILYTNSIFILLSYLPLYNATSINFQKFILWLYFITNLTVYATNFIDCIYYRFNYTRMTSVGLDAISHESNIGLLLLSFFKDYWPIFILFFLCAYVWIKLYKFYILKPIVYKKKFIYVFNSLIILMIVCILTIGGIRGGFKHSTRPINLATAYQYVTKPEQADLVLNTPFALIRTINKHHIKKSNKIPQSFIDSVFFPIKNYSRQVNNKPNVVLFIIESFAREYIGGFNEKKIGKNYKSYTPFIDSLAQHSLIFPRAYANGSKSIHAMPAILAGIPSFKVAYISSPYAGQKTNSLVGCLNEMGYNTSFFHGAHNGSMGFLDYSKILGFQHYYGKKEYNNDVDYDGLWGIWDKPFFNYVSDVLSTKKEPFMATIFSLSSHAPYKIPKKYKDKFPLGSLPIHKCIGYTDEALKVFFKKIAKEPWYHNTIFIITADHCNQIYYDEYKKAINRFAVPILLFSPSKKYQGKNNSLAQHIDIYPTILDIVGYQKSFRSWGRSLVSDSIQKPYLVTYYGAKYLFMDDSLICSMDGENVLEFYYINDLGLEKKIKGKITPSMQQIAQKSKGFIQDYMNKIIDKKL